MTPKRIFWTAWLVSLVLFFYPFQVQEGTGLGLDKVVHFLIFATLGYYGFNSYKNRVYHTFVLLFTYAFAVEYIQGHYIPHRSLDWYDALAGVIGLAAIFLHHNKRRK